MFCVGSWDVLLIQGQTDWPAVMPSQTSASCALSLKTTHAIFAYVLLAREVTCPLLYNFKGGRELQLSFYPMTKRSEASVFVSLPPDYHRLELIMQSSDQYRSHFWLTKNPQFSRAPVAHACNSSYSGGRDQEDHSSKPARANSSQDPILKKPFTKRGW
jgi:hypothetical protein